MKIAVYGVGPIGSTFAFHLARAEHEVTVVARGARLKQLQADGGIVTVDGQRAAVNVAAALPPEVEFDLVLVTVLAAQLDAILPALKASAARTIMFTFNTFGSLEELRSAVGHERCAFGFPGMLASLPDGKLKAKVLSRGQPTIASDEKWAALFSAAGIRTLVEHDFPSWLRTHAVLFTTLMSMGTTAHARRAGLSWAEARSYAAALREGFALVRHLGHTVTPREIAMLGAAPPSVVAALFWTLSRTPIVGEMGAIGPAEPRALVDAMVAVAPDRCATLREIRP